MSALASQVRALKLYQFSVSVRKIDTVQVPGLKQRNHDLEQRLSLAEVDAADARSRLEIVSADAVRLQSRVVWRATCDVCFMCRGSDLSKSVSAELQILRKRASELEG